MVLGLFGDAAAEGGQGVAAVLPARGFPQLSILAFGFKLGLAEGGDFGGGGGQGVDSGLAGGGAFIGSGLAHRLQFGDPPVLAPYERGIGDGGLGLEFIELRLPGRGCGLEAFGVAGLVLNGGLLCVRSSAYALADE
ncbi:MAG: hypothetical protein WA840_09075 [Caulobacteraceae bacterium]